MRTLLHTKRLAVSESSSIMTTNKESNHNMKDDDTKPEAMDSEADAQIPEEPTTEGTPAPPEAVGLLATEPAPAPKGLKQKLAKFKAYYVSHKKLTIPLTVLLVVGLLLAIPVSRYALLGTVIKKDFTATVLDAKTNQPVSSVELHLNGQTAKTDQAGIAKFTSVKVGPHELTATKKYYTDAVAQAVVPVTGSGGSTELKMTPTGRQVKVMVTNKITGAGLKDASVNAADTEAKTDDKGEATIVLPADKETLEATVTAEGYNKLTATVSVVEADKVADKNKFAVTPSGKIYFLSKRTGKINVMKSDLDGANAAVVLEATGNEDDGDTILLASQDWKYLALKSRRSGTDKPASLYLIDTANGDKLTTMDEGDASFTMTGWSGHNFVYQVQRDKVQLWQPNKYSLKGYDADSSKINVLDNSAGEGTGGYAYYGTDYRSEYFSSIILVGDQVSYTKSWISGQYLAGSQPLAGKQHGIYLVGVGGQNKKLVKGFDATTTSSLEGKLYEPGEVYYRVYAGDKAEFYELENGTVSTKGDLTAAFNSFYPTYLASPSNDKTFWAEPRDGKNTLFVGDAKGDNTTTVSQLSEFAAYGWFTQEYVLLSKNSSELYIAGASEFKDANVPVKITDYHKPNTTFYGYGGGYGGL